MLSTSHPDFEEQLQVVDQTLKEIGAAGKPTLIVFNKIDNYHWTEKEADDLTPPTKENITLDELKRTWMARENENCIFISAKARRILKSSVKCFTRESGNYTFRNTRTMIFFIRKNSILYRTIIQTT